ncbi:hypothetical protein PG990_003343 [Apiospora arundinis]|uniref:Uncharacterized protein n=1 Tax=Apiospora arundinis TaxID=335852 RepID=A0ABR2IHH7_9PEZI
MTQSAKEGMSSATMSTTMSTTVDGDGNDCWYGHLPCVRYNRQGCDYHNPGRKPIYRNPSLLPRWGAPKSSFSGNFSADIQLVQDVLERAMWRSMYMLVTRGPEDALVGMINDIIHPSREDAMNSTGTKEDQSNPAPLFCDTPDSRFKSTLPFDTGSITPLEPIHSAIPYHLAFYHLHCARRRHMLNSNSKTCFIGELSCHGRSVISPDVPCNWSSEVYYSDGTFLQKQELTYTTGSRRTGSWPPVEVRVCRHKSLRLQSFEVKENAHGLLVVSLFIQFLPKGRWVGDTGANWNSTLGGNFQNLYVCDRCHSDLEYHIEVVGREVRVRFTCSRDLGDATARFLPKWHILQTAALSYWFRNKQYDHDRFEGRCDDPSTYDVYKRVWRAAAELGRPNLHLVTFRTSKGDFSALSD